LDEIKHHAHEELEKNKFSREEREELINKLLESHEVQQKGVHSSNKAAAWDLRATVANIAEEVSILNKHPLCILNKIILKFENLSEQTGCQAFAFITCGHVNDTTVPA
jgi:hypothetical protein